LFAGAVVTNCKPGPCGSPIDDRPVHSAEESIMRHPARFRFIRIVALLAVLLPLFAVTPLTVSPALAQHHGHGGGFHGGGGRGGWHGGGWYGGVGLGLGLGLWGWPYYWGAPYYG
jgi:hypothetical protein